MASYYGYATSLASESSDNLKKLVNIIEALEDEVECFKDALDSSRKDEQQAMFYLQSLRDALEFNGDFPSLIEYAKELKQEINL